jgi:hypothetical protein
MQESTRCGVVDDFSHDATPTVVRSAPAEKLASVEKHMLEINDATHGRARIRQWVQKLHDVRMRNLCAARHLRPSLGMDLLRTS